MFISKRIRIRNRIQEAKQMGIQTDPDPRPEFSQKVEYMKNILRVGDTVIGQNTYLRSYKSLFEGF
jgi:hypothetical protein